MYTITNYRKKDVEVRKEEEGMERRKKEYYEEQ